MIRNSKRNKIDHERAATSAETIHENLNNLLFASNVELMLATIDEAYALKNQLRAEEPRPEIRPARRKRVLLTSLGVLAIAATGIVTLQPTSYIPAQSQIESAQPAEPPSSALYPPSSVMYTLDNACSPLHPQFCE